MERIIVGNHDVLLIPLFNCPLDYTGQVVSVLDGYKIFYNGNLSLSKRLEIIEHEKNHILNGDIESFDDVETIESR